jgi:hypothetical protein
LDFGHLDDQSRGDLLGRLAALPKFRVFGALFIYCFYRSAFQPGWAAFTLAWWVGRAGDIGQIALLATVIRRLITYLSLALLFGLERLAGDSIRLAEIRQATTTLVDEEKEL